MSGVTVEKAVRLFLGRGLRGDLREEETDTAGEQLEVTVDLPALQVHLEQAMLNFDTLPRHCWMPLTTTVGGLPELVFDDTDGLIPTQTPIWHLAADDATVKEETP